MKKYLWIFLLVASLSLIYHLLGVLHILPWQIAYSDIAPFAKRALSPGWFYLDKPIEYPIIIGLIAQLTGWIGRSAAGYFVANGILEIIFGLLTTSFLIKMTKNLRPIWIYWIAAPSMFVFLNFNWDIIGIFFTVLGLYLAKNEKQNLAAFSLALGFCTKLFPIVFLLPILVKLKSWRQRVAAAGVFLSTAIAVNIFFIVKNFDNWLFFYRFNSVRALNPDSVWTLITPLFGPYLYNVNTLNVVIFLIMAVSFAYILFKYRTADLLRLSYWIIILFFIFNKIFTPQYILWLLPFFVIVDQPKKSLYYVLELVNFAIIFGFLHFSFRLGHLPPYAIAGIEVLAVLRTSLLVAIFIMSLRKYVLTMDQTQNQMPRQISTGTI